MSRIFFPLAIFGVTSAIVLAPDSPTSSAANVTIDTVLVGNPGNSSNPLTITPLSPALGGVDYNYRMGSYEITNAQYVEFLNAKAAEDSLQLYNSTMALGITRSGASPNYTYSPALLRASRPVAGVNYYDTLRFINWLNNGQGNGDTETGAYTLFGGTAIPTNPRFESIVRNPGARWYLPTADEWFKAAFYQPAALGGPSNDYWLYATRSNVAPTAAVVDQAGTVFNPGVNVATYRDIFIGQSRDASNVGNDGPLSTSFYGTYDQSGNVNEWTETVFKFGPLTLGGSLADESHFLQSSSTSTLELKTYVSPLTGFRVMMIPEPSTGVLAILSLGMMWTLRKRMTSR